MYSYLASSWIFRFRSRKCIAFRYVGKLHCVRPSGTSSAHSLGLSLVRCLFSRLRISLVIQSDRYIFNWSQEDVMSTTSYTFVYLPLQFRYFAIISLQYMLHIYVHVRHTRTPFEHIHSKWWQSRSTSKKLDRKLWELLPLMVIRLLGIRTGSCWRSIDHFIIILCHSWPAKRNISRSKSETTFAGGKKKLRCGPHSLGLCVYTYYGFIFGNRKLPGHANNITEQTERNNKNKYFSSMATLEIV